MNARYLVPILQDTTYSSNLHHILTQSSPNTAGYCYSSKSPNMVCSPRTCSRWACLNVPWAGGILISAPC